MRKDNTAQQPQGYNFVLVGNMNVGKTSVFSKITSGNVRTINIPGSTVAISSAAINGEKGRVYDTPGIASIFSNNEDERATREVILSEETGCDINGIVLVADAKNLKRSLAIALQYSEFGLPMLFNINMLDEAVSRGIEIDTEKLSDVLGIEVTGTIAPEGIGIREMLDKFGRLRRPSLRFPYPPALEAFLRDMEKIIGNDRIAARGVALLLLHGDRNAMLRIERRCGGEEVAKVQQRIDHYYEETPNHSRRLLTEFYNTRAAEILAEVQTAEPPSKSSALAAFGDMCTAFTTGIPIALVVLVAMYFFIGEFGATWLVDTLNSKIFEGMLFPLVTGFTDRLPSPFLRDMIMDPDFGILSTGVFLAMGLVLPVIFCFYISFGILEDSGYLPRISILLDNILQKIGLNGKGVIPLAMGFSCVTMALLTTRILNTEKEKNIASFLLYLCSPCAPLIAVMLIILDKMPASATIAVFLILTGQVLIAGYFANRILPGQRFPLFLEIPPMRIPLFRAVLRRAVAKTWFFMLEALPVFIAASFAVFLFERAGGLTLLEHTLGPVIGHIMGLPEKSVQVFIKTMIRRESGATELEHLRHLYTNLQLVVNLLVMTLVAPCMNALVVLFKERGMKVCLIINIAVLLYAIAAGSLINHLCLYFGITFS